MSDDLPGCFSGLNMFKSFSSKRRGTDETSNPVSESKELPGSAAAPCYCTTHEAPSGWQTDKPPAYALDKDSELYRPEVVEYINKSIDSWSADLRELSLKIHDNPELQWKEKKTHDTLTAYMESRDFKVTRHYLNLDTAWRAEWSHGKGGRVIGVNSEMDALPGIGHACGHNLIAICGVGVALAVKAALQKFNIAGKVVLLGTPAEEGGGGKVVLLDRGGYKDMDACVMSHPGPGELNSSGLGTSLAIQSIEVEYFGHTAHAAAAPWEGQNALDAAFLAYSAVSVLRQQIKPDHRVHGIVKGKNWAANVIPDYAQMHWIVRAPSAKEVTVLKNRVKACIEAAASATACKVKIDTTALPYYDLRQNKVLAQNYGNVISKEFDMTLTDMSGSIGGSTDFGNITYALPAIHPMFAIPTKPNGGNHTILFTEAARTMEAHEACLKVTKGLAHTGFRVVDDDVFFNEVKEAYEIQKKMV